MEATSNLTKKNRRKPLFNHLNSVLDTAQKKYNMDSGQSDLRKLKWGRLIIQAVQAYGKMLESDELEEIRNDIELIKKEINMK